MHGKMLKSRMLQMELGMGMVRQGRLCSLPHKIEAGEKLRWMCVKEDLELLLTLRLRKVRGRTSSST